MRQPSPGHPLFQFCISNPPYQLDNQSADASRRSTTDIFGNFQQLANLVADTTSMIYPATWQKSVTAGVGRQLLDHGLFRADHANSNFVFPSITAGYPLSIVACRRGWSGELLVNNHPRRRDTPVWVDNEAQRVVLERTQDWPKLPAGLVNLTKLSNVADSGLVFHDTPAGLAHPVSIYIKANPGVQSDAAVRFIEVDELRPVLVCPEHLDRWKVAIRSAPVGRMRFFTELVDKKMTLGARMFGPNEAYALTWITVAVFDNFEQAQNFANFVNTRLYLRLVSVDITRQGWGALVPDLGDWSAANPVFTPDAELPEHHPYRGLGLEERLEQLFGLDTAEVAAVRGG